MAQQKHIEVGNAQVNIFNVGMLRADLLEWFGVPIDVWPDEYRTDSIDATPVPIQCVHIQHGETSLLVDTCLYDITPDSPYAIPGYASPPSLVEQMALAGISADAVTHIAITHAHFDHFNGLTRQVDGERIPVFANAQVYLGKADWTSDEMSDALKNPDSVEAQTLGVLNEHGMLMLVEGELHLDESISLLPSPGETPGHQSVCVVCDGYTLHCIGDLYHHAVELAESNWSVTWADSNAIAKSRQALHNRLADEDAILIATHIDRVLTADDILTQNTATG